MTTQTITWRDGTVSTFEVEDPDDFTEHMSNVSLAIERRGISIIHEGGLESLVDKEE